jgi:hypothetical protein
VGVQPARGLIDLQFPRQLHGQLQRFCPVTRLHRGLLERKRRWLSLQLSIVTLGPGNLSPLARQRKTVPMKAKRIALILPVSFALSYGAVVAFSSDAKSARIESPADLTPSPLPGSKTVLKTDSEGRTWGYVSFPSGKLVAPDFVATTYKGKQAFIAKSDMLAGPPVFPDGTPTGQPTGDAAVYDISGRKIGTSPRGPGENAESLIGKRTRITLPPK